MDKGINAMPVISECRDVVDGISNGDFKKAKKKLIVIKKGDHSLSDLKSLKMMRNELSSIIKNIS